MQGAAVNQETVVSSRRYQRLTGDEYRLLIGRGFAKQLPDFPMGWMWLGSFRLREVDLNIIKACTQILHLSHGIPPFIALFPSIPTDQPHVTSTHGFHADRGIRSQHDRDRMDLVPGPWRVHRSDRKIAFPSTELEKTIVGYSRSDVLQLRGECHDPSRLEDREVGDAESRLLSAEVVPEPSHKFTPVENPYSDSDNEDQKADQ